MSDVELRETILVPEGIELRFGTASASDRIVALSFDLATMLLAFLLGAIPLGLMFGQGAVLLWFFLLRQGYFVWFKTRWNGSTPGKRRFNLRVVRADGGPLTTEILLARNLTREVELFLPVTLLLAPDALFADHVGVIRLVASLWVLGLLFFPLCNPQRLRIGDLLAGTRVVMSPSVPLLRDMADPRGAAIAARAVRFVFSEAQLSIYGEHELQVLEDVLRKARLPGGDETLAEVSRKIVDRIAWEGGAVAPRDQVEFLRDFYAAQRQHLESRLLLGRRRARKQGRGAAGRPPES